MYYVYILKSDKDSSRYIGVTADLKKRFQEHNSGGAKYSNTKRPYEIIWYGAFIEKAPYSIFAEAQGPSGGMPIGAFINGHLQVEIYEYHNLDDVPGSSPDTIYKPDMVFNLSLAQRSSNPDARYWHILDLFRQDSDSDYGYVIAPKNKIITGSSQLGDSWAGIPSSGGGMVTFPGVTIQPLYEPAECGDGIKEIGEFCDAGINNGTCDCNAACTGYMMDLTRVVLCGDDFVSLAPTTECGDGVVEGSEVCDEGENNGICGCNFDCDGTINDGEFAPLMGCSEFTVTMCGNGFVESGEICDGLSCGTGMNCINCFSCEPMEFAL